jgi:hypothetical protein
LIFKINKSVLSNKNSKILFENKNFFESDRLKKYLDDNTGSTHRFKFSSHLFDEVLDSRINNASTNRNDLLRERNKNINLMHDIKEKNESCEMCGNKYRKDEEYMSRLFFKEKENSLIYNTGKKYKDINLDFDVLPTKSLRAHFLN